MICTLTIVRYPRWLGWAGFISMAVFRLPLFFNKQISFWKLMGCGKNGTFDIHPDWRQWALLTITKNNTTVYNNEYEMIQWPQLCGAFIMGWWKIFGCEKYCIILEPMEGHGTWDGKEVFGNLPKQTAHTGTIAVLTRATIRLSRLKSFWKHVDTAASQMHSAEGFITSVGIGEVPWIKQATFSVWQSKEHMKQFAYKMKGHAEVVRKTRQENWYSEDMFIRFKPLASFGSLHGKDPLKEKL